MKVSEIKSILGGDVSSKNSKMPGTSFGLSTDYCNVGGALRDIPGSVCHGCYAKRLEDFRPSVKKGWSNRAEAVLEATKSIEGMAEWVAAMAQRLDMLGTTYHRWHDSGDLLNANHLRMIISVAHMLPHVNFWLPTREKKIVNMVRKGQGFPHNLTVRVSAAMVGEWLVSDHPTSMVFNDDKKLPPSAWVCPARHQGNSCGDCRACWDSDVMLVAYPKH
jgi:hypothetical protein